MVNFEESSIGLLGKKIRTSAFLFRVFIFILLFFSLYLLYLIATPFLHVMILAIVFSGVAYPIYLRVLFKVKKPTIASIIVVLSLVLCIILPTATLLVMLVPEAIRSIARIQQFITEQDFTTFFSLDFVNIIQGTIDEYFPFISFSKEEFRQDLLAFSKTTGQLLFTTATSAIKNIVYFLIQFFLFLVIMFFLLRDGEKMFYKLKKITPLNASSFERITSSLRRVSRAVFVGGFMVAIAQALCAGIGFWVIGYPALLGGFATGLASLIPVIGTGIIWVPLSFYLFAIGETQSAFIFLIWNIVLVTNIDSFLRPYFMSGNVSTSVLFIFLSILGGINSFGMLGIFYGPLILAFVLVMLDIYQEEYLSTAEADNITG